MKRTPEQLEAIRTVGINLCVDAAAGSGKTSVLVDRILYLIEEGLATLDRIVAITFTENAASEMKERLRRECRKRAPQDNPERMSFWRDVERRVETARISTIHGFCSRLLRENALHLGLDPDFAVLAEAESHLLRVQAVTEGLHELLEEQDPAALRVATEYGIAATQNALRAFLGRPALLEGIGRAFPMDDPDALRAMGDELASRLERERLLDLVHAPKLRRFRNALAGFEGRCSKDSDGREVLRVELLVHLDRILAGPDAETIRKSVQAMAEGKSKGGSNKNWDSPETFAALAKLQDKIRDFARGFASPEPDPAIEARAAELACDFHAVFRRVAQVHDGFKGDGTALDFEDLIYRALNMLRQDQGVRKRTAESVRYLLIDEFQDTDAVQFEIAGLLAGCPGGPELFIVGDAKQSIYYFRGADVEVFRGARRASGRIVSLSRNFRSTPEVVHFVNDVFTATGLLRAVETEYLGMEPHRDPCNECRVEFLLPEPVDEGRTKSNQRAREAELIAARLVQLCGNRPATICDQDTGASRPAGFGDVAILFRSFHNVYLYEQSLRKWGIPYTLVAGTGFYERQEIVDMRNLLSLVVDPWDEMALFGFLRSPMVGISDEGLLRMRGWGEDRRGIAHAFNRGHEPDDPGDADLLRMARDLVDDLRRHRDLPLPELLRRALDLTGYEAVLLDQFLGTQKASNVRKLLDLAYGFSHTRAPRLGAFLRYLDEVAAQEVREGEATLAAAGSGTVTLTTIHKSKGLEYPIVVVPDLARQPTYPYGLPIAADRDLGLAAKVLDEHDGKLQVPRLFKAITDLNRRREEAEEARILYVALTRARDWLLLGGAADDTRIDGSWFDALLEPYRLLDRSDGEEFGGPGWRARVLRRIETGRVQEGLRRDESAPPRESVEARLLPVPSPPPTRQIYSVSRFLDLLDAETDVPRETESAPPADPAREGFAIDARFRGTLLHLLFQRWDLKAPARDAAQAVCRKECPTIADRERIVDDLAAVAQRFQETDLGRLIARQSTLQREVPFILRVGDALVTGAVDAVLDDGAIVDYKTGRHDPRSAPRYERQVLLYAVALRELCRITPPVAYLAYVDTGENVAVAIDDTRLDAVLQDARDRLAPVLT